MNIFLFPEVATPPPPPGSLAHNLGIHHKSTRGTRALCLPEHRSLSSACHIARPQHKIQPNYLLDKSMVSKGQCSRIITSHKRQSEIPTSTKRK
ncbi:hypothetical protein E2C01_053067 [Portunus trituberculatus]|uniref:Uncharacterized protein n=1 Tax=Portunus trituberculatus TaxID=210409 RepID=A0A5B7GJC1_PORTR|nr:hypothetical protein [Portunus trituberculatus]